MDQLARAYPDKVVQVAKDSTVGNKFRRMEIQDPSQINREVLAAVARECPPDDIAAGIKRLLNTRRYNKDGVDIGPDTRALEAGCKLALAYSVGLPVQRQEILSVALDADNALGLADRLRSPAVRAALRAELEKAERLAGG